MDSNERELIFKDEVYQIVGAAMEVSSSMGCGFLEAVYQEALGIEFSIRKIPFTPHPRIQLRYKGRMLQKEYIPDFLCFGEIIIEIKSMKSLTTNEDAQILNYLKGTEKSLGVLLNFGPTRIEWKRLVR
ncbi:MAG: GxxExxY protein [Verrucomicrobiota bacterium]